MTLPDWAAKTQTEEEWLKWRKKGIGSSDIPIILGKSPWKTPYKLWLEKAGLKEDNFKGNWATERGKRLEPEIRSWYNDRFSLKFDPKNKVSEENETWRASADGYDSMTNRLIEIKAPNLADHRVAVHGEVPAKYYPQCQWLLLVFNVKELMYISFNDKEIGAEYALVPVLADKEYQDMLKREAMKFWSSVLDQRPPETDEENLEGSKEIDDLFKSYGEVKMTMKHLSDELKKLEAEIKEKVNSKKAVYQQYTMTWSDRKGSVDYAKIPELKEVDLDKYRKPSTKIFTIREKKS